jgi:hypothetical protein
MLEGLPATGHRLSQQPFQVLIQSHRCSHGGNMMPDTEAVKMPFTFLARRS